MKIKTGKGSVTLVVLLAIWFYGRSRHDANRAAAYRTEMEKVI